MMIFGMRSSLPSSLLAMAAICGAASIATAQGTVARVEQGAGQTVSALLISDIHFDPFHDPGKVKHLAAAPVSEWRRILLDAPSAGQQQAFDSLQGSCHARGVDTPFALLESSLQAMRAKAADAKLMTVSGDLIAHGFDCRFAKLMAGSTAAEYQAFVLKTIEFEMSELRTAFPGIPVYATLGNNDSGCGDYKLDANSDFLGQVGKIIAGDLLPAQQRAVVSEFGAGGNYSVMMTGPMRGTRLIALDDLFLSVKYRTCAGNADTTAPAAELAWLKGQLEQARKAGEKVWVLGHIPPGIDSYSTLVKLKNVCGGDQPVTFLAGDALPEMLAEYGDVVRLGIFAHTHMDELRLLAKEGSGALAASGGVAIKLVSSISPVDGNNPSFTLARIDPAAATLADYRVFAASNQTGMGTAWSEEYDFAQTFHESAFTAASVGRLIDEFKADSGATAPMSQAYLHNYFVGDRAAELSLFWPQYVCALGNYSVKGYAACNCAASK